MGLNGFVFSGVWRLDGKKMGLFLEISWRIHPGERGAERKEGETVRGSERVERWVTVSHIIAWQASDAQRRVVPFAGDLWLRIVRPVAGNLKPPIGMRQLILLQLHGSGAEIYERSVVRAVECQQRLPGRDDAMAECLRLAARCGVGDEYLVCKGGDQVIAEADCLLSRSAWPVLER